MKRRHFLAGTAATAAAPFAGAARANATGAAAGFDLAFSGGGIARLRHVDDAFGTDYLSPGLTLGAIGISLRAGDGTWRRFAPDTIGPAAATSSNPHTRRATLSLDGRPALRVTGSFAVEDQDLVWRVSLQNLRAAPIEVGDLFLPLPMNGGFDDKHPLNSFVLKHSFVSGAGSFIYWMRANSVGPYLMMLPERGTCFEFWDHADGEPYQVYIHSTAARDHVATVGGTWRQPATSITLAPRGAPGSEARHAVRFLWADGHDGVRAELATRGSLDVQVVPGMTVPMGWDVTLAFRSTDEVRAIRAEHGDTTEIAQAGSREGRSLHRVRFGRLGENRLEVVQAGRGSTWLEFFVTEPLDTLIAKRGAFIARHQHRDPSKWYHGLLAEWNAETGRMLGPDDYDRISGWRIYEVSCDDPGLSKPAFLAAKNAEYPVQAEVDALDLYVDRFVWGGLQRTTAETHPYGIYGIPDWKQNRDSPDAGPKGRLHIWRPYDYPHIFCMYFAMWRIARLHPQIRTRLPAAVYLTRAAETALAMFTIPKQVVGWSAYETGFYNECIVPEIVAALAESGDGERAAALQSHWERKVSFFVTGRPNLFGSEYAFDSTGFESTQAFAAYAVSHAGAGDLRDVTAATARRFADGQVAANIFCRGSIEPAYYLLGSDYRGRAGDGYTLSYMAQMGGGAILDYGLHMAGEPARFLRLGYQSILSSWALINSGDSASGYGYWFPGAENDGAAGGGFEPAAYGRTWLGQPHHRGSWYYACEIDLGFCGALRAAATILADDPVFGRICLGGTWIEPAPATLRIQPRDGVRRRFHTRLNGRSMDLVLDNDRFAADAFIEMTEDGLGFSIESSNPHPHDAHMLVRGLPGGTHRLTGAGGLSRTLRIEGAETRVLLPIDGATPCRFQLTRQ